MAVFSGLSRFYISIYNYIKKTSLHRVHGSLIQTNMIVAILIGDDPFYMIIIHRKFRSVMGVFFGENRCPVVLSSCILNKTTTGEEKVGHMLTFFTLFLQDTEANEDHFPHTFFKGAGEGFWWSFISMTTVG